MGLDTSHGCWNGSYSAFARWRAAIAEAAGLPPLHRMDGFCRPSAHPISWEAFNDDPLTKLLNHSDCDGEIDAADCAALAARLAEVLPKLPLGAGGGLDWRETTQRFIEGLLAASAAGESVEFH